jgi:hypothetical protein
LLPRGQVPQLDPKNGRLESIEAEMPPISS